MLSMLLEQRARSVIKFARGVNRGRQRCRRDCQGAVDKRYSVVVARKAAGNNAVATNVDRTLRAAAISQGAPQDRGGLASDEASESDTVATTVGQAVVGLASRIRCDCQLG